MEEKTILRHFFTNADKPVFALRNMPQALQSYLFMGVSRFPSMRERFIKMLQEKGCAEKAEAAIKEGSQIEQALLPLTEFAAEKNKQVFFEFGHRSAAEGASIFLVSEQNPIYATEIQQDFYYPMTTMEFSTRYATKFSFDGIYWDPALLKTEFAGQAKQIMKKNLELYQQGFETLMQKLREKNAKEELPEKVSALDSLRFLIPIAAHTSVILGGNVRAVMEHLQKLLSYNDSFIQEYAKQCVQEAAKIFPEYFQGLKADEGAMQREKKLRAYAESAFAQKFKPVKENVKMFFDLPMEETALAQILYSYCNIPFEELLNKVSSFKSLERKELFKIATGDRKNRQNPARGFETRPIVFEIEAAWAMWKDFKRQRMNLRFQQPMRGLAGFDTPELIKGSELEKEYNSAMQKTSELIEKVYQKYGALGKTVAAQGNRKRFLLCMGARQLTVLTELRTSGEGDKGYRRIASEMIELAKQEKPLLFGHIQDNFKKS
jgi:thymidylate synthase ThyX